MYDGLSVSSVETLIISGAKCPPAADLELV